MKSPPPRLIAVSSVIFALILCVAVLTIWVPQRWSVSLFQGGVLLLGAVWAVRMIYRPYTFRVSAILIPLGGTVLTGLVQLITGWTVNRWQTWNAVLAWFVYVVAFLLACQIFASPEILLWFRQVLVYFAFVLSVLATMQMFTSGGKIFWLFQSEYTEGTLGPFVNPDHYAAWIELAVPLALFEALRDRRRRLPMAMMAAAMVASVIAGASRAGSILVLAECAAIMLLALRRAKSGAIPLTFAGSLALCILAFGTVAGWTHLWKRFQEPDPFHGRREILSSTLAMARDRIWTCCGLGNFENVYPQYAILQTGELVDHAHDDWAEWAAEGGLVYFGCLLCVGAWAAVWAVRSVWGIGVLSVLLHSLIDFPMQKPALALWFFVLLGGLAAQRRSNA